jgi:hypothetical protein
MVDYRIEQFENRYRLPRQKKGEKLYCRIDPFQGKRVVRIGLIYALWSREDSSYRAAAATPVPIGPDIGKTLGNPESEEQNRLRRSRSIVGWRHSSVRSSRILGKRGTRRLKRWLLPQDVVAETLEHLDVLTYPELYTPERIEEAKKAPHPYWTTKRRQHHSVAWEAVQRRLGDLLAAVVVLAREVVSSASSPLPSASAMFICAAVRPPCLEYASSMMIAKAPPLCSSPIMSRSARAPAQETAQLRHENAQGVR